MALVPDIPPSSALLRRMYARLIRRRFRRRFAAVLAQCAEGLEAVPAPLVIYSNHASWWDPLLTILLSRALFPNRLCYAPMDADLLARRRVLGRIGFFPIARGSPEARAQLLRGGRAALAQGAVLWLTPQARLADVREFPLAFRPGFAALLACEPHVTVLPLAVEYTFWDTALPHALVRFGKPQSAAAFLSSGSPTRQLESALAGTMLELEKASLARDTTAFRRIH